MAPRPGKNSLPAPDSVSPASSVDEKHLYFWRTTHTSGLHRLTATAIELISEWIPLLV